METCVSTAHQSNNKSIYGGTFGWTVLTALQKKYEVYSLCPLYFYQLLALTIQQEKPELETEKTRLLQQEEDKKIQLAQLEESLLEVCTHTHFTVFCGRKNKLEEEAASVFTLIFYWMHLFNE